MVERAAVFRATPAVCEPRSLSCGRGGGDFLRHDRRLRSARNVDGPGLVEDDVAARVVVGERVGGRGDQLIRREALPVREPRDDALLQSILSLRHS